MHKNHKFAIITLFPDFFRSLDHGIPKKARKTGHYHTTYINPRHYADNNHGFIDDRPYGGGPGMVMAAPPLSRSISAAKQLLGPQAKVIFFSPHGKPFTHQAALALTQETKLIFLCGRYEGIDQRLIDTEVDQTYCLSDCVMSGGEIPTLACLDAMIRLLPGVLNNPASAQEDSFATGLLDHPHYTRPQFYKKIEIPSVLLSGNHDRIQRWCRQQALKVTYRYRPKMLDDVSLNPEDNAYLNLLKAEMNIKEQQHD